MSRSPPPLSPSAGWAPVWLQLARKHSLFPPVQEGQNAWCFFWTPGGGAGGLGREDRRRQVPGGDRVFFGRHRRWKGSGAGVWLGRRLGRGSSVGARGRGCRVGGRWGLGVGGQHRSGIWPLMKRSDEGCMLGWASALAEAAVARIGAQFRPTLNYVDARSAAKCATRGTGLTPHET